MPAQYIPVFIFAILAAAFPAVTLIIFKLIRPDSRAVGDRLKPYECGILPEGTSRGRYSVRFYIIAILFVIFDVDDVRFPGHSGNRLRLAVQERRSRLGLRTLRNTRR
jgi:NADH-quinone oxidoreductase subunit A